MSCFCARSSSPSFGCRRRGAVDIKALTTPLGIKPGWCRKERTALAIAFLSRRHGLRSGRPIRRQQPHGDAAHRCAARSRACFRQRQEDAPRRSPSAPRSTAWRQLARPSQPRRGFELLRLALVQPRFDADMVEQRRAQIVAASIRRTSGRPRREPHLDVERIRRPSYAAMPDGTPDDLKKLTPPISSSERTCC